MGSYIKPTLGSNKTFSILSRLVLLCLCLACYILIVLLYCAPQIYHLRGLIFVDSDNSTWRRLKPTVVVGLLSALLSAATSALLTKAVDNSLWRKLSPETTCDYLTVRESRLLARWSTSASSRLEYIGLGRSWLLRFATPFLLATSIVSPVLLAGITPTTSFNLTFREIPATLDSFSGYLDPSDIGYNGGDASDNLHIVAALGFMSNLSAPAAQVCTSPTCSVNTTAAAILATCVSNTYPDTITVDADSNSSNATFRSTSNPELYSTVSSPGYPYTYVNFTTGYPSACYYTDPGSCHGLWSNIFGAWINVIPHSEYNQTSQISTVDCTLEYGNVTIFQNGTGSPSFDRSSFSRSKYPISHYDEGVFSWHRIYSDLSGSNSPYTFAGQNGGTENTLYLEPIGLFLLNYDFANSSEVARRLEGNFDAASLAAFARAPGASNINTTTSTTVQKWTYNKAVLAVLVVPLIATIMAGSSRWRLAGEAYLGYDPLGIAALGPVQGMPAAVQRRSSGAEKGPYVALNPQHDSPDGIVDPGQDVDGWIVSGAYEMGQRFKLIVSPP